MKYIGGTSVGGTYVLRMTVDHDLSIPFGRFDHGKIITVDAGEYSYVGSALNSLARRLVKHATRLGDHRPQPIRDVMLREFPKAGWPDRRLMAPNEKRPFYNVDHLLDQPSVSLVGAYLVRFPNRAEASIGKFLEIDPATVAFEPGLGANDIPGNTHLLRVDGGEKWWQDLPARLFVVAKLTEVHGDEVVRAALHGVHSAGFGVTDKHLGSLTRMHSERSADILHRLAAGTPYTRAVRESEGIYDTTGYSEVVSRLARGRGSLLQAFGIIGTCADGIIDNTERRKIICDLAKQVRDAAKSLRDVVTQVIGRGGRKVDEPKAVDHGKPITFNQLAGKLRQCLKFTEKNRHDVPLIDEKVGVAATTEQRDRIHTELRRIVAGADGIHRMTRSG